MRFAAPSPPTSAEDVAISLMFLRTSFSISMSFETFSASGDRLVLMTRITVKRSGWNHPIMVRCVPSMFMTMTRICEFTTVL